MKIGYMLWDVMRSLFRRPVTVRYLSKAGECVPVPDRFRGRMAYDREACIGCLLCIKTCPSGAIITAEEQKVEFHISRCIFCGQCVEICPKDAIKMTSNFEIVVFGREGLIIK
jgi:formate hydrogenlyase subunit 6/NADH:ubiquinone oxidoreductase subunit I